MSMVRATSRNGNITNSTCAPLVPPGIVTQPFESELSCWPDGQLTHSVPLTYWSVGQFAAQVFVPSVFVSKKVLAGQLRQFVVLV